MTPHKCMACGGRVDAKGYAHGGSIDDDMDYMADVEYRTDFPDDGDGDLDDREREQSLHDESSMTDQQDGTEDMREKAFAEAFANRRHGDFTTKNPEPSKPSEQNKEKLEDPEAETLSRKKKARYGFGGAR